MLLRLFKKHSRFNTFVIDFEYLVNLAMPYCVAFGCKSRAKKGDGLSFHSFPKDNEPLRQKQWVHYCKRKDFTKPSEYSKLCSKHFSRDCFERDPEKMEKHGYENAQPHLKPDAVPDIPLVLPSPKKTKKATTNKRPAPKMKNSERGAYTKRRRAEVSRLSVCFMYIFASQLVPMLEEKKR